MLPIKMLEQTLARRMFLVAIVPVVIIATFIQAIVVGSVEFARSIFETFSNVASIYKESWRPLTMHQTPEPDEDYWNHI